MNKKDQILELYFIQHLQQVEISTALNISQQYISKILKADSRYLTEKENRKMLNSEKRKQYQKDYQEKYNRKKLMIIHTNNY